MLCFDSKGSTYSTLWEKQRQLSHSLVTTRETPGLYRAIPKNEQPRNPGTCITGGKKQLQKKTK